MLMLHFAKVKLNARRLDLLLQVACRYQQVLATIMVTLRLNWLDADGMLARTVLSSRFSETPSALTFGNGSLELQLSNASQASS